MALRTRQQHKASKSRRGVLMGTAMVIVCSALPVVGVYLSVLPHEEDAQIAQQAQDTQQEMKVATQKKAEEDKQRIPRIEAFANQHLEGKGWVTEKNSDGSLHSDKVIGNTNHYFTRVSSGKKHAYIILESANSSDASQFRVMSKKQQESIDALLNPQE